MGSPDLERIKSKLFALNLRYNEVDRELSVTRARIEEPRLRARPLGAGVFGYAGGGLMSHRLDFPRPGFARVGWVVMSRTER